jgi:hypothetical protein
LLFVDTDKLQRHETKQREDLHFGARFDAEKHIRGLASRPTLPRTSGPETDEKDEPKTVRERAPNRKLAGYYWS